MADVEDVLMEGGGGEAATAAVAAAATETDETTVENRKRKRKTVRFVVDKEMDDKLALEHSRDKYQRTDKQQQQQRPQTSTTTEETNHRDDANDTNYESKHTLDSDEEEEVKYRRLDIREVEGQESATQDYEGDTKITAFNMEEEMDDGHFDATGTFIFDRHNEAVKDAWLDNIDWAKIKKDAGEQWQKSDNDDGTTTVVTDFGDRERLELYEKLINIMQPHETIAKALRRIGNKQLTAAEERKRRWAAKKATGASDKVAPTSASVAVETLTALADELVSNGDMEAYQLTYEKIGVLINDLKETTIDIVPRVVVPIDKDLDIFGDAPSVANDSSNPAAPPVIHWEYKLSEDEDATVVGSMTTEQMIEMQTNGQFANGAWARRSSEAPFYSVSRIDFDLYL